MVLRIHFVNDSFNRVDLDIEGGSTEYYTDFINQLRSHMDGASKQ